jgi:phage N-6-adenine-methyltransferase
MKFEDFQGEAIALLSSSPLKASDLARKTGASSAVYQWLKKMVNAGTVVKGDDGLYRLPDVNDLSEAFVEERIAEVEVIEMRMPRASMTVAKPKAEAEKSNFTRCEIADIEIPSNRLRALNVKKVKEIAESINFNGQLHPIAVCKSGEKLTLMAGLHRLEACKLLGYDLIDCSIRTIDPMQAELIEIEENLVRQELTVLEESEHYQRRDELLDAMGLRAKVGFNGNQYTKEEKGTPLLGGDEVGSATVAPPKTSQEIASDLGLSKRTFQERKQIAKNIDPDVKEDLRNTEIANSTTQLVEVARMEPETQKKFGKAVKAGEVSTVKEFKEKTKPKPVEVDIPPTVSKIPEPSFVPDINNYTVVDGHIVPKLALEATDDQSSESPLLPEKQEGNRFTSLEKSAKTDEHYTPEKITNFLYQFCPEFDLDPCSNPDKNIRAKHHFTKDDDGLAQEWNGSVFINPPFSDVETWVNKAIDEYMKGNCKEVVFLSKFDGRVGWFRPLIGNFSPFCIVQGYVSYYGNDGDAATFTTALWYLGDRRKEFTQVFEGLGWVCQLVDLEF